MPDRNDRPIAFQADRMTATRGNRYDVRPARNIALPVFIVPDRDDRPVTFQADHLIVTHRDRHNVRPARNIALPPAVIPDRHDRPIAFQADRMTGTRGNRIPLRDAIPERSAALLCVRKISELSKGDRRLRKPSVLFKGSGCGINCSFAGFDSLLTVLVAVQRFKRRDRLVVLPLAHYRNCCGIFTVLNFFLAVLIAVQRFKCRDRLVVLSLVHQGDRIVVFAVRKNDRYQHDDKGNAGAHDRHCNCYDLLALFCGLFGGKALSFRPAL